VKLKIALLLITSTAIAEDFVIFRDPGNTPSQQLTRYLNSIAFKQLDERTRIVSAIRTRADAEARKKQVREKLLTLIGGLPDYRGPLNVKQHGTVDRGDYRIEKIVYDSLPGFHVTADVYVPTKGTKPFPAILMPVGHGRDGKGGSQQVAIGLALKGFIALAYDPIGQGERLQYYDPESGNSKVGGATDEHSHANGHTMLIGDSVARYRIWDGIRGIDYLVSRGDVDASRIGCTGCSGGGTLTTYISALDDRVKAAAPACYITSWRELLTALGPQDGEQVFPNFLRENFDMADFIEVFAPKPWLMVNTINDFFPLEGARQTYEEARNWYSIYGAEERIGWHIGPGGHGWPKPSREAIYRWFIRWLKNGEGDANEPAYKLNEPDVLLVTQTGQVADSLGGETVFTLNRKRAADLMPRTALDANAIAGAARELAAIEVQPGTAPPKVTVHRNIPASGYRIELLSFEVTPGVHIPGMIAIPDGSGLKTAVLLVSPQPKSEIAAAGADFDSLAQSGHIVLAISPRGIPESGAAGRASVLGNYGAAMRSAVVGKTLVGMRTDDILHAVSYLTLRADVKKDGLVAFGQGVLGAPLLHAALLDKRIHEVIVQDTIASYRLAVDRPLHRNLYDVAIPGVLRRYDLDHILGVVSPTAVTVLNPVDAYGNPLRLDALRKQFAAASHVRFENRSRRDPLSSFLKKASSTP
jgi:cephalosporin-C deacetylase-like acetyl esterase